MNILVFDLTAINGENTEVWKGVSFRVIDMWNVFVTLYRLIVALTYNTK